ncbi:MAG TPA: hypothetical protein VJX47_06390 [Candidatus Sulfotelmatobacter sp.]|nr:hypothetical protein [Candidatus Sulfotelmatobacter sp.]
MTNETATFTDNDCIHHNPADQSLDEATDVPQQPIGFVPTLDELVVLAKHWVNEAIDDEYFIFWGQCYGLSDVDQIGFDWARVREIEKMLGHEATRTAIEEAYSKAAQDYDRNHWIVFRYGTAEERAAYQKMGGQCLKEFEDGLAERLVSQVMKRVLSEGTAEQQTSLLKEEVKRQSITLHRVRSAQRQVAYVCSCVSSTARCSQIGGVNDVPARNV